MKDPNILVSLINCKLRDSNKSLESVCDELDLRVDDVKKILEKINYYYNDDIKQFVCKC